MLVGRSHTWIFLRVRFQRSTPLRLSATTLLAGSCCSSMSLSTLQEPASARPIPKLPKRDPSTAYTWTFGADGQRPDQRQTGSLVGKHECASGRLVPRLP
jgi:hypothetical protein